MDKVNVLVDKVDELIGFNLAVITHPMYRHLIALHLPARTKAADINVGQGFPGDIGNTTASLAAEVMVRLNVSIVAADALL